MTDDIVERTSSLQREGNVDDTLDMAPSRLTWLILVIGRAIVAGASVWIVYLGLKQTYWAWMIVRKPEMVPMPSIDPSLFIFLTILCTCIALVVSKVGLTVAFTARITDIGAVVEGDNK